MSLADTFEVVKDFAAMGGMAVSGALPGYGAIHNMVWTGRLVGSGVPLATALMGSAALLNLWGTMSLVTGVSAPLGVGMLAAAGGINGFLSLM